MVCENCCEEVNLSDGTKTMVWTNGDEVCDVCGDHLPREDDDREMNFEADYEKLDIDNMCCCGDSNTVGMLE